MKIKTLGALCKSTGCFVLFDKTNADGEITGQWLGADGAMFPLDRLPIMTEDNIITFFDITAKQRENMNIKRVAMPEAFNVTDVDDGEVILDRTGMTISYGKRTIEPLITSSGLEFIDVKYLTPLADLFDLMEIYERKTTQGGVYFAAKVGLVMAGIIMPLNVLDELLVFQLEETATRSRAAFDVKKALEAKREAEAAERQRKLTEGDEVDTD